MGYGGPSSYRGVGPLSGFTCGRKRRCGNETPRLDSDPGKRRWSDVCGVDRAMCGSVAARSVKNTTQLSKM